MSKFEKLVRLLDHPDDNYWGDILAGEAREIIDSDPEVLLSFILEQWESWPENRLEHLAYLLGEGVSNVEEKLIIALHGSKYKSVVFHAKEAVIELESTRNRQRL
ncbi:hypothetical protein BTA51_23480 [Hahella sp. CCB-MM4]|uniref:hypothetical protein n=1 Tax=Hahella sp. (strain CCB-MM4) TaxID=1926491 RepID=UPI000B9BCF88|nr:hypothetical protein [Hahella sp. CCB-MM4]OZG71066.1 hypothetical protein BTA51_23480 [Hahella sp. CCB-MM4]